MSVLYAVSEDETASRFPRDIRTAFRRTSVEDTRQAVVDVIEDSWHNVVKFIPPHLLPLCESDLKAVTSLLVLAVMKRVRDLETGSEGALGIESMFQAADRDGDGSLTFAEWFDWLAEAGNSFKLTNDRSAYSSRPPPKGLTLVSELRQVLSFSANTVNVVARVSTDPSHLVAAFVAGGMATGSIAPELYGALLSRLRPEIR